MVPSSKISTELLHVALAMSSLPETTQQGLSWSDSWCFAESSWRRPQQSHKDKGFPIGLHLDPKENKYLEEFNTSNFAAITKDGRFYVTPDSSTILPSVTNWCLVRSASSCC
mmetsp:Transcript_76779/g.176145  ORF Transcript_76779/g.176145 Transcript_76779/m.176145 type:complete len:112 (+) Transcript_76779:551-886(+)